MISIFVHIQNFIVQFLNTMSHTFNITLSPKNAPIHTKVIKLYLSYILGNSKGQETPEFLTKEIDNEFKMVELTHGSRVVKGSFAVLLYLEKFFKLDLLKFGTTGSIERALVYSYSSMSIENFVENLESFENEFINHRSFVLGHTLSLADFYVFALLNESKSIWVENYTSTKRYFNFIKNLPQFNAEDLTKIFGELPEIKFNFPAFEYVPLEELSAPSAPKQQTQEKGNAKPAPEQQAQGKKKEKKEKKDKAPKPQPKAQAVSPNSIDIRVGRIVEAIRHPEADKLYIEKIDIGEEKPRQIVSGLYQKIPLEKLQNSLCLVMVNLKPAVMVGVESSGMLLSAVTEDKTKFDTLVVPEGSVPGERIVFTGSNQEEQPDKEVNSKKLQKYLPNFKTNDKGQVYYEGEIPHIARTSKGIISAPFTNGYVA